MPRKNAFQWGGDIARAAVAVTLLCGASAAFADRWGAQLAIGSSEREHDGVRVQKIDLGAVWDPGWAWWRVGNWHFTFVGETHAAYWRVRGTDIYRSGIFEVGVTPIVRFIRSSGSVQPFIEAGAGVRLLSHPAISSRYTLSSAFQFSELAGVGVLFGQRQQYQSGFRYQHVSNASIKEPNPGINFMQIYLQYNF